MITNVGVADRFVRIAVGLALMCWALGYIPNATPSVWGWIGAIPFLSGVFGYCPVYSLFGVDTCKHT